MNEITMLLNKKNLECKNVELKKEVKKAEPKKADSKGKENYLIQLFDLHINQSAIAISKMVEKNYKKGDKIKEIFEGIKELENEVITDYEIVFANNNNDIHIRSKKNKYVFASYSLSNKKLSDNNCKWLIFNLPQFATCPNATTNCVKYCYADKSNNGLSVLGKSYSIYSRVRNYVFSNFKNFDTITLEVIKFLENTTKNKIIFRFHESGDFYNECYMKKSLNIINKVSSLNVKFMIFTKSLFMLDNWNEFKKYKNLMIRFSCDTSSDKNLLKELMENNNVELSFLPCFADNLELTKNVNHKNICNAINDIADIEKIENDINIQLKKIEKYKKQIENIKNNDKFTKKEKTEKIDKIEKSIENRENDIIKINKRLVNKNVSCSKCFKCFNRDIKVINMFIH